MKTKKQGELFGDDITRCCQSRHKSNSLTQSQLDKEKRRFEEASAYRKRLIELRANILSVSALQLPIDTVTLSDASARVGESSPLAKYSDADLIHCFDLRLAGMSLREISKKMDIPIRTLRDIFSGRRRAVMPTKFK